MSQVTIYPVNSLVISIEARDLKPALNLKKSYPWWLKTVVAKFGPKPYQPCAFHLVINMALYFGENLCMGLNCGVQGNRKLCQMS